MAYCPSLRQFWSPTSTVSQARTLHHLRPLWPINSSLRSFGCWEDHSHANPAPPKLSQLCLPSKPESVLATVPKASPGNEGGIVPSEEDDDGVSLGTMKLPPDTDLQRFEILLFQWANSLCQGANLPLPVPLKVDKIEGGARLGFITIGDGKTEVPVYIDCLVFLPTDGSAPIFRAIRNGRLKDQPPPGEPRIMRSLLAALKKSVEIARL